MRCKIHKDTELVCPRCQGPAKCNVHNKKLVCLSCQGAKGGAKRAKRHSKKELSKWSKLGGRPGRPGARPESKARPKRKTKKRKVAGETPVWKIAKKALALAKSPAPTQTSIDKLVEQYTQPINAEPAIEIPEPLQPCLLPESDPVE